MWILKFHISISVLCIITFLGFAKVFKEQIKNNGWIDENKKKKFLNWLFFFVPIMNVLFVLLTFMMIFTKKEEFEQLTEYIKKESEENE